jgi:hypothetical protein
VREVHSRASRLSCPLYPAVMGKHNRLVIESTGRVIRAVNTSEPSLEVAVIDRDEAEEGELPARGYPASAPTDMGAGTKAAASAVA